jgi:hypothetical protein
MIGTEKGSRADGERTGWERPDGQGADDGHASALPEGPPVPLTRQQVIDCFRVVMDLLTAQQLASLAMQDVTESLPRNLLPEHQCTIAFLANAIDKVDDALAGVVEELEVLRASLGGTESG